MIAFFTFYLVENVIYLSGYLVNVPHLYFTSLPLLFLLGPMFYHYVRDNLEPYEPLAAKHLSHLIPFIMEFLILLPFYLLSSEIKLKVYENSLTSTGDNDWNIYFIGYLIYIASTIGFVFSAFLKLKQSKPEKRYEIRKLTWLKYLSYFFIFYITISGLLALLPDSFINSDMLPLHFSLICQVLIIHSLGYVAYTYPDIINSVQKRIPQYEFSALDGKELAKLEHDLIAFFEKERPFIRHKLSLEELATDLGVTKNNLSQVLSTSLNTSFYDFVNKYRVEEAKKFLTSPNYDSAKIIHVALDSGFSNKSSFLRNFKKNTGMTPTEYRIKKVPLS
ncbi:MAG: helix-turn-helix transcriptional regulator [Bacteroidota bacterium]